MAPLDVLLPEDSAVVLVSLAVEEALRDPPFDGLGGATHAPLRHPDSERVVTITEDRGTYWIKTKGAGAPMAMLCDSVRHDEHTARTFAKTIAGGYDASLSRP